MRPLPVTLALSLLLGVGCVEDLSPPTLETDERVTDTDTDTDTGLDRRVELEGPDSDGTVLADIDSGHVSLWVHLDLDTPEQTTEEGDWSLKFQRYTIALNGGVSGVGDVEAVFVQGLDFEDATQAPVSGWSTDLEDADDDGKPEYVFNEWYDYDSATHVLTPKPGTWFVRGLGGQTYALELLDYYSEAGDSGHPSLRYRPVEDPAGDR